MTAGWLDSVVRASEDLYMESKVSVSAGPARQGMSFTRSALRGIAVLGLVLLTTIASAQSLADVARQEQERRKAVAQSGKVYTNDTLKTDAASDAGATKPAPGQPAAADASAKSADATKKGDEAKKSDEGKAADSKADEATWKKRLQAERDALARSQTFADALQSRINALATDFVNRDDPAQRNQIAAERQKALDELERVKKDIQDHTKAISAIQEEGRRAGVPAGWLR